MQHSKLPLATALKAEAPREEFKIPSYFRKNRILGHVALLLPGLMLALSISAPAESPNQIKFNGVINDYTPATGISPGGPWEVRGHWSLLLKGNYERGDSKADFSAALTMERSDQGVVQSGGGDYNSPMDRMAHTHHITLINGEVTTIPSGIQITGPATVTANGIFPPPFGSVLPMLTIQITGGTGANSVPFSNITVLFGSPAQGHFGPNPLHGVVRSAK